MENNEPKKHTFYHILFKLKQKHVLFTGQANYFFLFHITYLPFTEISLQFIISTHPEY